MTAPPPASVCAVCRQVLDALRVDGGPLMWRHTSAGMRRSHPHEPVPVPRESITDPMLFCDFCSAPGIVAEYVTGDSVTQVDTSGWTMIDAGGVTSLNPELRLKTASSLVAHSSDTWGACADCVVLIDARQLQRLAARATDAMPPEMTRGRRSQTRRELTLMYESLFAGPAIRRPV